MFFSYLGRVASILILILGSFEVITGFLIAFGTVGPSDQALSQYLPTFPTTGAAIDKGFERILLAIVLGVITEISFSLRKTNS
jgi:hypothetical protein